MDNGELKTTGVSERDALPACDQCHRYMCVPMELDVTPLCHDCAHIEVESLRAFVIDLFAVANWPEGGDIDGGDLQELAAQHGILKPETRTAPCAENCFCAEFYGNMASGVICYRKVEWLARGAVSDQPSAVSEVTPKSDADS